MSDYMLVTFIGEPPRVDANIVTYTIFPVGLDHRTFIGITL